MKDQILKIQRESLEAITKCEKLQELMEYKVKCLGKKGELTTVLRGMGKLAPEERPVIGELVNYAKNEGIIVGVVAALAVFGITVFKFFL